MWVLTREFILICPGVNNKWSCLCISEEFRPEQQLQLPNHQLHDTWVRRQPGDWFAGPHPHGCQTSPLVAVTSQIKHDGQSIKACVCCLTDSGFFWSLFFVEFCQKTNTGRKAVARVPLSWSDLMRVEKGHDFNRFLYKTSTAGTFQKTWRSSKAF